MFKTSGRHSATRSVLVLAGWAMLAANIALAQSGPEVSQSTSAHRVADLDPFALQLLGMTVEFRAKLDEATREGLIQLAPIHLPIDPPGDCDHYGWPIGTRVGDTIVIMHRRIPGHNPDGAGRPHEKMSYGIVLYSDDSGKTWSEPYDLRDSMTAKDRLRGGLVPLSHRFKFEKENKSTQGYKVHLHSIGTTRDGGVLAINNHGVFRSDDRGRTWRHFSTALRDDTFPHEIVNVGPNIIDHPRHGITAFGNWYGTVEGPKQSDQFVVLQSPDGGEHWSAEQHPVGVRQYEPAALAQGDSFLFVVRDQADGGLHRQIEWRPSQKPKVIDTNLRDPRYLDTVDFSFNPVTKRFEVVRSERYRMELWLWSLDPADWETGKWRREARLFAREGTFYKDADGFHPAGAVIDEKSGVQHLFLYIGHPNGPTGIFRLTRTLDTPRLAAWNGDRK